MIIVAPSFRKSSVFKVFSVLTKMKSQCFKTPLASAKSDFGKLRIRDELVCTTGRAVVIKLRVFTFLWRNVDAVSLTLFQSSCTGEQKLIQKT